MPQYTNGRVPPSRDSWVFCALNFDEQFNNVFLDATEADEIVEYIKKLGLQTPDFLNPNFWSAMEGGACRLVQVYKAVRRRPRFRFWRRSQEAPFVAEAILRCVGRCPNGENCYERRDPLTRRLVGCICSKP